jgi:integrase/recombinase XerD
MRRTSELRATNTVLSDGEEVETGWGNRTGMLTVADGRRPHGVPTVVAHEGEHARKRFLEFFVVPIRNRNTRDAYVRAVRRFFDWCDTHGAASVTDISPSMCAAYVEQLGDVLAAPSVKQHLAAISMLFDWLVVGQVLPSNPAASVKGPTHVVKRGKTPVLSVEETRALFASIDVASPIGLRDRAIIGVMVYSFARVGAVVGMRVEDYFAEGKRWRLRLHEKGGKVHQVPAHHTAERYLDEYLEVAPHSGVRSAPLFVAATRARSLGATPMTRNDALRMVKRRARAAGLSADTCCHSFRATGITAYLSNGGTIEHAQAIAAHESPRTTKLYDRRNDEVSLDEIERIGI